MLHRPHKCNEKINYAQNDENVKEKTKIFILFKESQKFFPLLVSWDKRNMRNPRINNKIRIFYWFSIERWDYQNTVLNSKIYFECLFEVHNIFFTLYFIITIRKISEKCIKFSFSTLFCFNPYFDCKKLPDSSKTKSFGRQKLSGNITTN